MKLALDLILRTRFHLFLLVARVLNIGIRRGSPEPTALSVQVSDQ